MGKIISHTFVGLLLMGSASLQAQGLGDVPNKALYLLSDTGLRERNVISGESRLIVDPIDLPINSQELIQPQTGMLVLLADQKFYRIDVESGAIALIAGPDSATAPRWNSITPDGKGSVYAIRGSQLHALNPSTGAWTPFVTLEGLTNSATVANRVFLPTASDLYVTSVTAVSIFDGFPPVAVGVEFTQRYRKYATVDFSLQETRTLAAVSGLPETSEGNIAPTKLKTAGLGLIDGTTVWSVAGILPNLDNRAEIHRIPPGPITDWNEPVQWAEAIEDNFLCATIDGRIYGISTDLDREILIAEGPVVRVMTLGETTKTTLSGEQSLLIDRLLGRPAKFAREVNTDEIIDISDVVALRIAQ